MAHLQFIINEIASGPFCGAAAGSEAPFLLRSCPVKFAKTIALFAVLMAIWIPPSSAQQKECKCHSKDPAMKHMHETIGFKSCGNCHSKSENLMSGKAKSDDADRSRLNKRFKEDEFCLPCHSSEGLVKKEVLSSRDALNISGTYYCAKDKLRLPAGAKSCPKCGGNLIDINVSMERSRTNPSNGICIECHLIEEINTIKRHQLFNADKLTKCLDCHQGHDDCGSCHH